MALTATACGITTSNTSSASITHTLTAAINPGDFIVVCCAGDNSGSSGAASMAALPTDSTDKHGYTRRSYVNRDPGAASAGLTFSIWSAYCMTAMTTSSTVSVAFSPNATAKLLAVWKVTPGAGKVVAYSNALATATTGAATSATVTTASLDNGDCVIGCTGYEYGAAITADTDTTNGSWSTAQATSGGSTTSGMAMSTQSKIVTATATQTYNTSWTTSSDYAIGWVSFREFDAPVDFVIGRQNLMITGQSINQSAVW